jgi:O-antigen ligase
MSEMTAHPYAGDLAAWGPDARGAPAGERAARFFLCLAVAAIPLVSLAPEKSELTSQLSRITLSDLAGGVAILLGLFAVAGRRSRYLFLFAAPFLLWCTAGLVIAVVRPQLEGVGWLRRVMGLLIVYYVFLLADLGSKAVKDARALKAVLIAFGVAAAVEGVVILHDSLAMFGLGSVWFSDPQTYRLRGTFRSSGQLGQFAMAALFICYAAAGWPGLKKAWRGVLLGLAALGGLGAFFASRRSAIYCILVWGVLLAARGVLTKSGRRSLLSLMVLVAAGVAVVGVALEDSGFSEYLGWRFNMKVPTLEAMYGQGGFFRSQMEDSLRIVSEHPVFGCGISHAAYYTSDGHEIHNGFLSMLAETGVVGVLLLALPLGIVLGRVVSVYRRSRGTPWRDLAGRLAIPFVAWTLFTIHNRVWRDRAFWVAVILIHALDVVVARCRADAGLEAAAEAPPAQPADPAGGQHE